MLKPLPVGVIEAKAATEDPLKGMQQAKAHWTLEEVRRGRIGLPRSLRARFRTGVGLILSGAGR